MKRHVPALLAAWCAALLVAQEPGAPAKPPAQTPAAQTPAAQTPAAQTPAAQPPALERAETLLRQGQPDEALAVLRAATGGKELARAERILLARLLTWHGRSDEALGALQQGLHLGKPDDDGALQWEIGTIHRQLGDDGPFFRHEGDHVVYLPKDDKVDEEAWCAEHHTKALAAFEAVLALRPDDERTLKAVAGLQERLGRHEAALATWNAARKRAPGSSSAHLGAARALAALGRAEEAAAACAEALRLSPRVAEAHALQAELHEKAGRKEAAQRERQQADFYEWAPGFLELDFAAAAASFRLLAPQFAEEPADVVKERVLEERKAEIERLLKTRDANSSRLLALLCYHHGDHGETEARLFAELEARGAPSIGILRALLDNGQTTCTMQGAARALARLHAPGILETLVEMLPGDVRPLFYVDVAGALAELGDRAAVAPLLEFARLGGKPAEPADDDAGIDRQGREEARLRAVLALGALGGDEARAALTGAQDAPEIGPVCRVALYRISRDPAQVETVRAAVLGMDGYSQLRLVDYLKTFAPELAAELRAKADK